MARSTGAFGRLFFSPMPSRMPRALITASVLMLLPLAVVAQDTSAFRPDTIVYAPDGPRIVMLDSRPGGVAALRLSVPLIEHPAEAGAGALLAALAEERMVGAARQVGAQVDASRTPWGIAYRAEGAEIDIEYLAYLLRLAVEEPAPAPHDFALGRDRLAMELEGQAESPAARLLFRLRAAAAPDRPPIQGSRGSLPLLDQARLREVWSRSHQPQLMTLVVESSIEPEVLLASLDRMGNRGEASTGPEGLPAPTEANPQPPPVLRAWYGEAWVDASTSNPHAAVAARLISAQLEAGHLETEMGLHLWEMADRSILAVTGTSYTRQANQMKRAVAAALNAARAALDAGSVTTAVAEVELRYRLDAGTPGGLVEQVGRALDATDSALGAVDYLTALGEITVSSLTAYFERLTGPLVVEFTP